MECKHKRTFETRELTFNLINGYLFHTYVDIPICIDCGVTIFDYKLFKKNLNNALRVLDIRQEIANKGVGTNG